RHRPDRPDLDRRITSDRITRWPSLTPPARTRPGIEDYYRFGNKPGELFAWGTVNGELELCWELSSKPADTWTCVVADIRGRTGESYPGGMLDLLLDALGGTGRVSLLDYLREVLPTTFEPYS
ncbi:hypothetical protein AB0N38_34260, partial [Micromonospora aurantiaca]